MRNGNDEVEFLFNRVKHSKWKFVRKASPHILFDKPPAIRRFKYLPDDGSIS
jgi:hypothetical protein